MDNAEGPKPTESEVAPVKRENPFKRIFEKLEKFADALTPKDPVGMIHNSLIGDEPAQMQARKAMESPNQPQNPQPQASEPVQK